MKTSDIAGLLFKINKLGNRYVTSIDINAVDTTDYPTYAMELTIKIPIYYYDETITNELHRVLNRGFHV